MKNFWKLSGNAKHVCTGPLVRIWWGEGGEGGGRARV